MIRRMSRRRRGSRLARYARPALSVALLAAGLVLSGAFVGLAIRGHAVQGDVEAARAQIAQEQERNAQLQAEVTARQTDAYVVDKARELGYVRPGEGLIAVERGPEGPVVRMNASDGGRLGRWLAAFFGG